MVGHALCQRNRRQAEDVELVYTIYVVDDDNVLLGTLSLKRCAYKPKPIIQYNEEDIIKVGATMSKKR